MYTDSEKQVSHDLLTMTSIRSARDTRPQPFPSSLLLTFTRCFFFLLRTLQSVHHMLFSYNSALGTWVDKQDKQFIRKVGMTHWTRWGSAVEPGEICTGRMTGPNLLQLQLGSRMPSALPCNPYNQDMYSYRWGRVSASHAQYAGHYTTTSVHAIGNSHYLLHLFNSMCSIYVMIFFTALLWHICFTIQISLKDWNSFFSISKTYICFLCHPRRPTCGVA